MIKINGQRVKKSDKVENLYIQKLRAMTKIIDETIISFIKNDFVRDLVLLLLQFGHVTFSVMRG